MIWRDGGFLKSDTRVVPLTASFGVFTTVGCDLGRTFLWPQHQQRLAASITALGGPKGDLLPEEAELTNLLKSNDCRGPARLRVTAWREQTWSVDATVIPTEGVGPELPPLHLASHHWAAAPPLAGHKSLARLPWDLAREQADRLGYDDAVMVDASELVLETSSANIFARTGTLVITPPAPTACLPGVMRAWLLDNLPRLGLEVSSSPLPLADLLIADEVWTTNAVVGIRRVTSIDERTWSSWPLHRELPALSVPAAGWRTASGELAGS